MRAVSISDRYEATEGTVLLSGIEALVRLLVDPAPSRPFAKSLDRRVHQRIRRVATGRSRSAAEPGAHVARRRRHRLRPRPQRRAGGHCRRGDTTDRGAARTTRRRRRGVLVRQEPRPRSGGRCHPPCQRLGYGTPWRGRGRRGRRPALEILHPAQFVRADGSGAGCAVLAPSSVADIIPLGSMPWRSALCRCVGGPQNSGRHSRRQCHGHHPGTGSVGYSTARPVPASGIRAPWSGQARSRRRRTSSTYASPGSSSTRRWPGSIASRASPSAPLAILASGMSYAATQCALSDLGLSRA